MHLDNYASPPTFTDLGPPSRTVSFGTPLKPDGSVFLVGDDPLLPPDQPLVHPVLDYEYLFERPVVGGELGFDLHAYSLTRDVGADASRIISEVDWRRTYTDRLGQQFTPFFKVRGDVYWENEVFDPMVLPGGLRSSETVTRGMAAAGVNYGYPFISAHSWGSQVIEPMAQIIFRPDEQKRNQISNEDAQSLVFDDTILFDPDKFSGFDRTESGTRANVGVRYTVQTNEWGFGTVLLGQSFQLAGANPFDPTTGLGGSRSDYVGAIVLEPNSSFGLSSQFRLDRDSLAVRRHELKGWARYGPASASVTYSKHIQAPTPGVVSDREEILASGSLDLTKNWRLFGKYRYDIARDTRVQSGIGIGYYCDCATVRVDYTEDYFRDGDDAPNRTVSLFIDLKTLGSTTVSAGSGTLTDGL
jgi:LPS-assembly protein